MSVGPFCEKFVEATGKEAGLAQVIYINAFTHSVSDHVQITALCRVLRLNVNVAYLDGRGDTGTVEFVEFQNEQAVKEPITLLYRFALPLVYRGSIESICITGRAITISLSKTPSHDVLSE